MAEERRGVLLANGRELRVDVQETAVVVTALDLNDGRLVVREHPSLVDALCYLAAEPDVISGEWRRAFLGNREELEREAAIAGTWLCRGEA